MWATGGGTAAAGTAEAVRRGATSGGGEAVRQQITRVAPQLGNKLSYVFGQATGTPHNIARSQDMLRQMARIGLSDSGAGRAVVREHLAEVLNTATNIISVQPDGRIVRESLLMGPHGGAKLESIWEGAKLITVKALGG